MNLEFDVDVALTGTALITPDGGAVSVADVDGTEYTLMIPPGALLVEEQIAMTPLSRIEGLPTGVAAQGVLLEPDGLVLLFPAALAIESPSDSADGNVLGFGTFAQGEDFHLKSSQVDGTTVTLIVSHFSLTGTLATGAGVATAWREGYAPSSNVAKLDDGLAALAATHRDDPDGYAEGLGEFLEAYHAQVLLPDLLAAHSDESLIIQTLVSVFVWGQGAELYGKLTGDSVRFSNDILAVGVLWRQALAATIDRAHEKCVAGDPDQAANFLIWSLIAKGYGVFERGVASLEENAEMAEECLRFRLKSLSLFEHDQWHTAASFDVVLQLDTSTDTHEITAKTPLVHEGWAYTNSPPGCDYAAENGEIEVDLGIVANLNYLSPGLEDPKSKSTFCADRQKSCHAKTSYNVYRCGIQPS